MRHQKYIEMNQRIVIQKQLEMNQRIAVVIRKQHIVERQRVIIQHGFALEGLGQHGGLVGLSLGSE